MLFVWNGGLHGVFNSPDANANYYFAERLYHGLPGTFALGSEPNQHEAYLATRSTRVINHNVVPASFIGFIVLLGLLSRFVWFDGIIIGSLFFSAVGLFFWYRLLRELYTSRVAMWGLILLAIHPAWWYYTTNSLYPNVSFLAFLIIGAYYGVRAVRHSETAAYFLASVCIALALFIRLSEALWLLPLLIAVFFMHRRRITTSGLLAGGGGAALVITLAIFAQFHFFAGSSIIGYNIVTDQNATWLHSLLALLLPFGIHPRLLLQTGWRYGILIVWPFALLGIVGMLSQGKDMFRNRSTRFLAGATLFVAIALLVYYGSWRLTDTPDPTALSISMSYVRYFLPFYALLVVWAARFLGTTAGPMAKPVVRVLIIAVLFVFSYNVTMIAGDGGILSQRTVLSHYDRFAGGVLQHTEENAIIVTARGDKYIWPHRDVITSFSDDAAVAAVGYYAAHRPLYYVAQTATNDGLQSMNALWKGAGIAIGDRLFVDEELSLYAITTTTVR